MSEVVFTDLSVYNFLGIGTASISLENKGLVSIAGENQDDSSAVSNGSGKSSLADAIAWCIYGLTARGESGDKVVNRTVGKNCLVQIWFTLEGSKYKISRARKHSKMKNRVFLEKDGVDITLGTDKLTQELIERTIGVNYEVFVASVYSGQERMPDLPNMTDKELKILVENAAGINSLDAAYKIALEKVGLSEKQLLEVGKKLSDLQTELDKELNLLGMASSYQDNWKEEKQKKISELREEISELKEFLLDESGSIADSESNLKTSVDILKAEIDTNDVILSDLNDEFRAIKTEIGDYPCKPDNLSEIRFKLESVRREKNQRQMEELRIQSAISTIDQKISDLNSEFHLLSQPPEKFVCPTCGHSHDSTPNSVISSMDAISTKISLLESEKLIFLEDERVVVLAINNLERSIASLVSELDNQILKDAESHTAAVNEWKRLNEDNEKRKERVRRELEVTHDLIARLRAKLFAARINLDKFIEKRDRLVGLIGMLKSTIEQESPFEKDIARHAQLVEKLNELIADQQLDYELKQEDLESAKKIARMFSPKGLRGELLDQVVPFLNARTSIHLAQLSDGKIDAEWETLGETSSGEIREKFHIKVSHSLGADSFCGLSGGEKRKVRIACAMALQDLVSTRATKAIKLWVCDEIDDALDSSGLERLMVLLEQKAKEVGTVLVISHNDIRDYVRNEVLIAKKGAISYVTD